MLPSARWQTPVAAVVLMIALLVHNTGRGPELQGMLLGFDISGHDRYEADRP